MQFHVTLCVAHFHRQSIPAEIINSTKMKMVDVTTKYSQKPS